MRPTRSFGRSRKGGAAVELAVLLPVLVLLLVGVVDYGRAFYTSVTVANAARAGAEYGQQETFYVVDTAGMNDVAQADGNEAGVLSLSSRFYCECGGAAHACTACSSGDAPEVYVEVTATRTIRMYLRYPGLPDSVTISRKATFRSQ